MRAVLSICLFTILCLTIVNLPAFALDEIYSPNVEPHELAFEYNGSRTFDNQAAKNNAQTHELVMEYGINNHWETEVSAGFDKDAVQNGARITGYEWGNRLQFFPQGEYWLDSGLLIAFTKAAHSGNSDTLEVKLLLQKDIGRFTSIANIGFDQSVGPHAAGGPDNLFLWSTRYRQSEQFQPGFEIQSDLGQDGTLRYFSAQQHYIGPALYGRLFGHIHYETAYLFGVSSAAAQRAARLQIEYEMHI